MPIHSNRDRTPLTPEQREANEKLDRELFGRQASSDPKDYYPWCGVVRDAEDGQRWCCNRERGHDGEHRMYVQRAGDPVAARWSAK